MGSDGMTGVAVGGGWWRNSAMRKAIYVEGSNTERGDKKNNSALAEHGLSTATSYNGTSGELARFDSSGWRCGH